MIARIALPPRPLTEQDAEIFVASTCFKTGPPGRVGIELEWLVCDAADPAAPVEPPRLTGTLPAATSLIGGGQLSTEPGGQLELSSAPANGLPQCISATRTDLARLHAAAATADLRLVGDGIDPLRPPRRILSLPRYAAMEAFFDRDGPYGRVMMCSTASVQVSLEAGQDTHLAARWRRAHAIGPVLVATFANSPFHRGAPTGWRSSRQAVWLGLDRSRTSAPQGGDPRDAWASYALNARVLCVRGDGDWTAPGPLTFREWLRGGGPRPPTYDDLAYHLTTLFPPVRPRGPLELRMLDAQHGDDWMVALGVTYALMEDPRAADAAAAATLPLVDGRSPWLRAARAGLADPAIARAARACWAAALAALPRLGVEPATVAAVERWAERYVDRGRCPADDRLEHWRRTGSTSLQEDSWKPNR